MGDLVPEVGDLVPEVGDLVPEVGDLVPEVGDLVPEVGDLVQVGGHLVEVAKPDRTAPPAFSQTLTLGHSVLRLAGILSDTVGHQDLMDTICSVPHPGQCCRLHVTQTMCCVDGESGFLEANIIHTLTVCAI